MAPNAALAAAAVAAACGAGALLGPSWLKRAARLRRRRRVRGAAEAGGGGPGGGWQVGYLVGLSRRLSLGATSPVGRLVPASRLRRWFAAHARCAGVAQAVSEEGFAEASVRLALAGAAAGALVGCVFSAEMTAAGLAAGGAWGATAPMRGVKAAERRRSADLDRGLSEMLEVVALGVRSGLSFDRSFQLYCEHFDTPLAKECASAHRSWSLGLATREDALRSLADSYASPLFRRVVAGMVRSLRFGSSLAEALESAAAEARADHRAHVEERVAKAPVKMMVPTGTLILPAMLLLVLGPVLLELMEGF